MTRGPTKTTNGANKAARPGAAASFVEAAESSGALAGATATRVEGRAEGQCGPEEHARRGRQTLVSDDELERAASIFRAAGDLSRLKLLYRLCDGEWCVTELADAAGVGLSTVSQQLRLLRAERIVSRRRAGKHIFYSLADAHVSALIQSAIEHAAEPHTHPHTHDD